MVKGKAGKLNAFMIFVLIFLGFIGIIIMGIFVYGGNLVNQSFRSIDVEIGDTNFTEAYEDTLGVGINAFLDGADSYGLGLLLGMVILMIVSSFVFREKQKVWIVAEFVILIISMILTVTLQRVYDTVINSSTTFLNIYSVNLINSSKFLLNLHIIVPIVWAFIIIISYGLFRRERSPFSDLGA